MQGTPTYYILNREGRIAAKGLPGAKLAEAVANLLKSGPASAPEASERDKWQKPDEVVRAMNLMPGQVVVDIGAGSGYFTWRFATATSPTGKAIGIEIDSAMVRALNADARSRHLSNYEARLVPPDDPMLTPRSVDVVFLCDTYHHINDRVAYFAKVKQTLKPEGRLVIIDYVRTQDNPDHSIVKDDVITELRRAGYRLLKDYDLLLPKQYFLEFEHAPEQTPSVRK